MTILGFLPTKTAVEIRSEDGVDTMPAATDSAAGVMTAVHVKMLKEVYQRVMEVGSDLTSLLPQLPPDMSNYVTRQEVQQVLSRLPAMQAQQLHPAKAITIDVTPRVQALEGALAQMRSIKPAAAPNNVDTRLALVEARQAEFETSLIEVAQTVGDIEAMLRGLHDLVSVEDDDMQKVA